MAQTTTHISFESAAIFLDTAGGTLTNISGSTNKGSVTVNTPVEKTTTFDGDYPIASVGKDGVTINLEIIYSTTADEAMDIIKRWKFVSTEREGSRTCTIEIPDATTGSDQYSGEFKLSNLEIAQDSSSANVSIVTAVLENDGAFSWTITTS